MTFKPQSILFTLLFLLAAASPSIAQTHVFARGTDGSLMHFDGAQWRSLGGQVVGSPDACSWGRDRIDVVVRGTNNHLFQIARVNGQWSGWYDLGGSLTSSPTCASWGPNRIDLFARGADGTLIHKAFVGAGWTDWESLGGELAEGSSPDAASWGPNRLDVFVRWRDNKLWQKAWTGTEWHEWVDLGGTLTSDPGAISWGHDRISIFARRPDGQMMRKGWDGTQWSDWAAYGGRFDEGSGPDVAASGASHVELFARGMDGALWRRSWDGSRWAPWTKLGGEITSDPGAVIVRAGRGRFRVTLNGFTVHRQTIDHMLHMDGQHDEIYIATPVWLIDQRGDFLSKQIVRSRVMGDINRDDWRTTRVRAGSATSLGGLKTGDRFPAREPWRRSGEPQRERLPMLLWEGELVEGENVVAIAPTVWEWDGEEGLFRTWESIYVLGLHDRAFVSNITSGFARDPGRAFPRPEVISTGMPTLPLRRTWGSRHVDRLEDAGDRPIGMRYEGGVSGDGTPRGGNLAFNPRALVLTFVAAQEAAQTEGENGIGIFEIRYRDDDVPLGGGEYVLYLQVERLP